MVYVLARVKVRSHQPYATQQTAMSMSPIAGLTARQDCDWWSLASLFDDGWRVNQTLGQHIFNAVRCVLLVRSDEDPS